MKFVAVPTQIYYIRKINVQNRILKRINDERECRCRLDVKESVLFSYQSCGVRDSALSLGVRCLNANRAFEKSSSESRNSPKISLAAIAINTRIFQVAAAQNIF